MFEDLAVALDEIDPLACVHDNAELLGPGGGGDGEIVPVGQRLFLQRLHERQQLGRHLEKKGH